MLKAGRTSWTTSSGPPLTTIVVFALAMSCLWLTGSRFVTVLCILSVIYLVETEYKSYRGRRIRLGRGQKVVRTLIYAVLIVAAITAFVGDLLVDRTMEATSSAPRKLDLFGIYGSVWLEKPWFGHGLGSFNRVNDALMTLENVGTTGAFGAAHNVVLQWLIQQGIVGTILICTLFAHVARPTDKGNASTNAALKDISTCIAVLKLSCNFTQYARLRFRNTKYHVDIRVCARSCPRAKFNPNWHKNSQCRTNRGKNGCCRQRLGCCVIEGFKMRDQA